MHRKTPFLAVTVGAIAGLAGHAFSAAMQAANIIGVESHLARLSVLTAAKDEAATGVSLEELPLHQQITEAVVLASLYVDSILEQVDNERAQSIFLARHHKSHHAWDSAR